MSRREAKILILSLMTIASLTVRDPRLAAAGGEEVMRCFRTADLREADLRGPERRVTLPLEARRFADIRGKDIAATELAATWLTARFLESRFEDRAFEDRGGGVFNEVEDGAIVLVQTDKNWRAKLIVAVEKTTAGAPKDGLRIRRLTIYDPDHFIMEDRADELLTPGAGLTIGKRDGGAQNPPGGDDLRWSDTESGGVLEPLNGARLGALRPIIAVPTVARVMQSLHHAPSDITPEVWTEQAKRLLDLSMPGGSVNRIWRQAGILFWLAAVEVCKYSVFNFAVNPRNVTTEHLPWPMTDCQRLFRKMNAAYNTPGALNLYFWSQIAGTAEFIGGGKIIAFAAPDRRDGPSPGPGAVWMDGDCLAGNASCDRTLGHEIGHVLRLRHTCMLADERHRVQQCRFWAGVVPDCSQVPEEPALIMRGDFDSRPTAELLTPGEIAEARQAASERLRQ